MAKTSVKNVETVENQAGENQAGEDLLQEPAKKDGKKNPDRILTAVYHVRSSALALEKAINFDYEAYAAKKGNDCQKLTPEDVEELQKLHDQIMEIRNKYGQVRTGGGSRKPSRESVKKIVLSLDPTLEGQALMERIDQAISAM